jgi:osmotically-inducible protein OsmY
MGHTVRNAWQVVEQARNIESSPADEAKGRAAVDELIRLSVMNALHWDLSVPPHRVRVTVEAGWVTLSGRVDRPYAKSSAERHAREAAGAAGVTNAIAVEP